MTTSSSLHITTVKTQSLGHISMRKIWSSCQTPVISQTGPSMSLIKNDTTSILRICHIILNNRTNTGKWMNLDQIQCHTKTEMPEVVQGWIGITRNWSHITEWIKPKLKSHHRGLILIPRSSVCQLIKLFSLSLDLKVAIWEKPWKLVLMSMSATWRMTTPPTLTASGTISEYKTQEKIKRTEST